MYTWLNNDLAANTRQWTVVYFHHPPYTKGSHNSDTAAESKNIRQNIVPLLESYHVDLVLSGHSHNNERSYLIKGHYGIASTFTNAMKMSASTNTFIKTAPYDGTVYAICGTSGGTSSSSQSGYPMACMFYSNLTHACSMVIDVNGDNLSAKYVASTGAIVDQFTITKSVAAKESDMEVMNPARLFDAIVMGDVIKISYLVDTDSDARLELFNILQQNIFVLDPIRELHKGLNTFEIPKPVLKGLYFLHLTVEGQRHFKKILIE